MPAAPGFDVNAFIKAVSGILLGGLKRLGATAAADLSNDGLANKLGRQIVQAIADGPAGKTRLEMLKAAAPWLLTFYEFRITNEGNDAFAQLLTVVIDTASSLAGSLAPLLLATRTSRVARRKALRSRRSS